MTAQARGGEALDGTTARRPREAVAVEYLDVHKAFDVPVLAGVSLEIHRGETIALVGPSGTGKSVLLKTTIGLITPDSGDVRIDGESVTAADRGRLEQIRRKVGYVFQYAALFDSMTVYENVEFGLRPEDARSAGQREVLRRVVEALEDVNLEPAKVLGKLPAELSGGMRKRVGLARAIVGRPQTILYDEPVTGLDPVNTASVERLISDIGARFGVTSVLVTHDIEGALALSDRIALLDHGRLRFVGTPDEFRRSDDPLVRAFADREAAAAAALKIMEED
jgi:phospholipid/cholesterol/gamma-HCH transport system ATP-binding protein